LAGFGFRIGAFTDKNTSQEVAVIADKHDTPRQHMVQLIDCLIANYKADSLGLEALYGAPSADISEIVDKDLRQFASRIDPGRRFLNRARHATFEQNEFQKFVHQQSIPCYGIEDRDVQFKYAALIGMSLNASKVVKTMLENELAYDELCARAPSVVRLEQLFQNVKKEYPEENIPGRTLRDVTTNLETFEEFTKYYRKVLDNARDKRNVIFAGNIDRNMRGLNSQRGIVMIGGEHAVHNGKNTQDYLPFSSLVILGPGN
jgi:hypothetical protein